MNQIYRIIETSRAYFQTGGENCLPMHIAETFGERPAAQRLRNEVFATEAPAGSPALCNLDEDEFDVHFY
jgi:hypothetical protein